MMIIVIIIITTITIVGFIVIGYQLLGSEHFMYLHLLIYKKDYIFLGP